MEGRKLNLRNLCRICGSKIVLKYDYKTAKTVEEYSDVLYLPSISTAKLKSRGRPFLDGARRAVAL